MANFTKTSIEEFAAAAKRLNDSQQQSVQTDQGNNGKAFTTPFDFKYVACGSAKDIANNWKVLRFVGAPVKDPASYTKALPSDAHIKFIEKIVDQNGKNFFLILPDPDTTEGQNNVIWQIQRKVTVKSRKADGKVHYDVLEAFPEIDRIVNHCGLASDNNRYKFVSSWFPKAKVFMNCIDRSDDWCKTNKHTKVFCKSDNIDAKGNEWVEPGIKVFGFYDVLLGYAGKYKGWESFDTLVTRTGTMREPWVFRNASRIVEKELDEDVPSSTTFDEFKKQVVVGDLTDDELSYDRYDFDKITPSTPKQIMFHLGKQIKHIDDLLNTSYYDTLSKQCDAQEKAQENAETLSNAQQPVVEVPVQSVATRQSVAESTTASESKDFSSVLNGWALLNQAEKDGIEDVVTDDAGKVTSITYKDKVNQQYACDKCGVLSPVTYVHCPSCGAQFSL